MNDPIFAALQALEIANAEYARKRPAAIHFPQAFQRMEGLAEAEAVSEAAVCARLARLEEAYSTEPKTLEGLAALVRLFLAEDFPDLEDAGLPGLAVQTICRSILVLAGRGTTGRNPDFRLETASNETEAFDTKVG
jgi:hypothetical protein